MTVEEGVGKRAGLEEEKKVVMVGLRIDKRDQLLVTWALVKIAEPGDSVIAVNVCRNASEDPSSKEYSSLDCYLDAYKGLCNVKKINLTGKVSHGSSAQKVLVREANLCHANVVVVGISRPNGIGSWVSVAKYCARKLPLTTAVLALHQGKVVFNRHVDNQKIGNSRLGRDPQQSLCNLNKENRSSSSVSATLEGETSSSQMVRNSKCGSRDAGDESEFDSLSLASEYRDETSSCSISGCDSIRDSNTSISCEDIEEVSSSSIAESMKELQESTPGWPLLKGATAVNQDTPKGPGARNMSVVQWAMSLPRRVEYNVFLDERHERDMNDLKRFSSWGMLPEELTNLLRANSSRCRWFNRKELKNATSQFSSENLIGKGGCSRVYKGCLLGGKQVAVKIMKVTEETWNDFLLEMDIISSLKHKRIVPLVGICLDENEIILVYDFLSRGSLEDNLHGNRKKSSLAWDVRFNVAVGVAEALTYLHKEIPQSVIHRDIKSSNILLSDKFEPQLSDFGLAMWAPISSGETHSDVVGTFGYLAPEYFLYGKVSEKIDVYSYGVVLLELLSGRRTISNETSRSNESLVMWAKPILESGDIKSILDPDLEENYDEIQMQRMVLAATLCITRVARLRPKISEILELLAGEKDVKEWESLHANDPEFVNQVDDEAYPDSNLESHLDLAMLDVDDDTTSHSSIERNSHHTFEDYLKGRWSRSSSFN
ncbi:hypothetical protein Syun_005448 [Stephania yunnanensis]|uniref:Protein kinase domain-containing protein n=1 Tax=Stephania yunnanensis TaxID=152371 RepID=A0AAP0Q5Y5_9MAGN